MPYGFGQVPLYDGRWSSVDSIDGPVRSGPRGQRFWHFIKEESVGAFSLPSWSSSVRNSSQPPSPHLDSHGEIANVKRENDSDQSSFNQSVQDFQGLTHIVKKYEDEESKSLESIPREDHDDISMTDFESVSHNNCRHDRDDTKSIVSRQPSSCLTNSDWPSSSASQASGNSFIPEESRATAALRFMQFSDRENSVVTLDSEAHQSDISAISADDGRCTCPISNACPHKKHDELDCRPLVPEFVWSWEDTLNEEGYKRQIANELTANIRLATEARVRKIGAYLARVKELSVTETTSRKNVFEQIRDWINEMHISDVESQTLVSTGVVQLLEDFLSDSNADMRKEKKVMDWISEELTVVMRKWRRGDLKSDPNRGLLRTTSHDVNDTIIRTKYDLDKSWEHYTSARYYGNGELVNGQTWYSRSQLIRDGVHGALIAGIYGTKDGGAYSVIVGGHDNKGKPAYANIDRGDVIEYMGTALQVPAAAQSDDDGNPEDISRNKKDPGMDAGAIFSTAVDPTSHTQALMRSMETGEPVRVIRSFKLADIVSNKPDNGYRYDGLYRVTKKTPRQQARQIWSFRLERLPDQGRLRGFAHNESTKRPSNGKLSGYRHLDKGSMYSRVRSQR